MKERGMAILPFFVLQSALRRPMHAVRTVRSNPRRRPMQSAEFSRAARTNRDRFGAAFAVVLLLLPFSICHADGRKVITVTANQAHEWELQLEVELLADPLTF